jgi:aminomethyltransferase
LWDAVLARGITPCGLGARDTLRLEACYPLHGQDLTPGRTPIEAGLGWACSLDKEFPGVRTLRRQREEGPTERLVAFVMEERAIPRAGMAVLEGGVVTSGGFSPLLEQGIGMGYVPGLLAEPETQITIDVRGKSRTARVVERPIYRRRET